MNNLDLLNDCINNPEPIFDPFYSKADKGLVISKDPEKPNQLQLTNRAIIDAITALEVLHSLGQEKEKDLLIEKILDLLMMENMNYTELACFFSVNDLSYSKFMSMTKKSKREALEKILPLYIAKRHKVYKKYGYSDTTLQVQADSFSHKSSGPQAQSKISVILNECGIEELDAWASVADLKSIDCAFICPDSVHSDVFADFLEEETGKRTLEWTDRHEGKMPDFLIKIGNHYFVGECKHVKESGGGQDKQINEIIDFINYEAPSNIIHYVSYLDGVYFNKLFCEKLSKKAKKVLNQRDSIIEFLKKNQRNYFVNTHGFKALINSFLNSLANS